MQGKSSFIILLSIVAFLSLTLAGLVVYVFFFATPDKSVQGTANLDTKKIEIDESKLGEKSLYDGKKYFNLKSIDDKKISVIQVGIKIKYRKEVAKLKEKDVLEKLTVYDSKIKEHIGIYFRELSIDDVKKPDAEENARAALVNQLNSLFGQKEDIIYTIVFDEWFYQ